MFSIYPLIWSIACTLVGMAVVLRAALIKRLRDQHPAVWEELGSPSPIGVSAESLWGWVWRREYAKLNDTQTFRLATWYRTVCVVLLLGLIVAFVQSTVPNLIDYFALLRSINNR
jgi:hypothetical protein